MFHSSRFIAFCVATVMFVTMMYTTSFAPMELAGAISVIAGVYIVPRSYRGGSEKAE